MLDAWLVGIISSAILSLPFFLIMKYIYRQYDTPIKKVLKIGSCVGIVTLGFFAGVADYNRLNRLSECEKNGHEYSSVENYHNVFEKTMELKQVVTDSHYEDKIEGSVKTSSILIWHSANMNVEGSIEQQEEYKFYYKTADGGYKKTNIPVENTTVYYITDGEPYVEVWRQYGNYEVCSVCGEEQYDWQCNFYKLYVPQGSITEEIQIK